MVDAANEVGLALVPGVELLEDEQHEVLEDTHDLVVMLLELHLEIETCELGQVTSRVRVLSAEDRANLHNLLEARSDQHLLVELWRLGKVGLAVEVLQLEDVGTSFRSGAQDLGSLNKCEALLR